MKDVLSILVIIVSLFIFGSSVYASEAGKTVIPYGDFCTKMNRYGVHAEMMDHQASAHALHHYFHKKGVGVRIIERGDRFIKAQIMDEGRVIDTILFDRRTGRMRSIY